MFKIKNTLDGINDRQNKKKNVSELEDIEKFTILNKQIISELWHSSRKRTF